MQWRQKNGKIKLYTDKQGYELYKKLDILSIWDEIDTETLEGMPKNIDHYVFWAGSKFFAMQKQTEPFCMMDTDFVVWQNIANQLPLGVTKCIHREDFNGCYWNREHLQTPHDYVWDDSLDWSVLPANGAFVYHGNQTLLKAYTEAAINYMVGNLGIIGENLAKMVFCEQRLLSMVAKKLGVEFDAFITDQGYLYDPAQKTYSHLWGTKHKTRVCENVKQRLLGEMYEAIKRWCIGFDAENLKNKFIP